MDAASLTIRPHFATTQKQLAAKFGGAVHAETTSLAFLILILAARQTEACLVLQGEVALHGDAGAAQSVDDGLYAQLPCEDGAALEAHRRGEQQLCASARRLGGLAGILGEFPSSALRYPPER